MSLSKPVTFVDVVTAAAIELKTGDTVIKAVVAAFEGVNQASQCSRACAVALWQAEGF